MLNKTHLLGFFFIVFVQILWSQQLSILTLSDFDLKGPVEKCVVFTKYGQEQYAFNEKGYLISAATIFSKDDSETAYYKYEHDRLVEKRVEVYVNGRLDKSASLASFYSYERTPNLAIKERIMNYDRVFIDQFQYKYDSIGRLFQQLRTNLEGRYIIDISQEWDSLNAVKRLSYLTDSLPVKKVDSFFKTPKNLINKVVTTQFAEGAKKSQSIELFNQKKQLIKLQELNYLVQDSLLVPVEKIAYDYAYNELGNPVKEVIKKGVTSQTKKLLYQLDGSPYKNWIKKIVTPDNTYTTRRISYFEKNLP